MKICCVTFIKTTKTVFVVNVVVVVAVVVRADMRKLKRGITGQL